MSKLYETITAENWIKGDFNDGQGRGCLLGHGILCPEPNAYDRVLAAIRVLYPLRYGSIPSFNDHPDTTLDDVLRVCKLADV